MPRPRRRKNDGLPPYTQRRKWGVIYTPYLGRENGKSVLGKPVNLGPADMTVTDAWLAYNRETKQDTESLRWLLTEYVNSKHVKGLAARTQKDYAKYREILIAYPMANGKPFGSAQLSGIKRTAIKKFLDKYHAPIQANRLIQFTKAAWNWGLDRHDHVPENPCNGVKLNKQKPRERYVTQEEFAAFKATTKGYTPLFMELGYLCRARWSEIAKLKRSDLLKEGVRLQRSKGSEGEVTAWNPRLLAAISACKEANKGAPIPLSGEILIHDKRGSAIRQNAFQSAWGRAMRAWESKGNERFTFHDLKAAGYSDMKKQSAGHKSERMHSVYNRKLQIVEPAE